MWHWVLSVFGEAQFGRAGSLYNASWATMLQEARVNDVKDWETLETWHTVHLSEVLRAAPAAGKMKSLVFLTTHVNDKCVFKTSGNTDNRLCCVRGLSLDPMTGNLEGVSPAAAFFSFRLTRYRISTKDPSSRAYPTHRDLPSSYQVLNGRISFGKV